MSMYLIELLLPLTDNEGRRFPATFYAAVNDHLVEKFGGVTAFTRTPASGSNEINGQTEHDEIVIFEVMVQDLEADWWKAYRQELETLFQQRQLVLRSHEVRLL